MDASLPELDGPKTFDLRDSECLKGCGDCCLVDGLRDLALGTVGHSSTSIRTN